MYLCFTGLDFRLCKQWQGNQDEFDKMACRPSEDSGQPGHTPVWSVSSLSAWRKLGSLAIHWTHSKDWSDWAEAQADLSLRWAHMPFVGFVMRWHKWSLFNKDLCVMMCHFVWNKSSRLLLLVALGFNLPLGHEVETSVQKTGRYENQTPIFKISIGR